VHRKLPTASQERVSAGFKQCGVEAQAYARGVKSILKLAVQGFRGLSAVVLVLALAVCLFVLTYYALTSIWPEDENQHPLEESMFIPAWIIAMVGTKLLVEFVSRLWRRSKHQTN
jgi:hypothetical protein